VQHQRWPAIVIAGLLILTAMSPWFVPGGRAAPTLAQTSPDLTTAVQLAASETPGVPNAGLIVRPVAAQGEWAYGTATSPAAGDHGTPVTRFFLGRLADDGWTIVFRYTDAFSILLAEAPASFPTLAIRATLDGFTIAGDGSSQLGFPFPAGQTWSFAGPHPPLGMTIRDGLDFSPISGQTLDAPVLAMRGGIVYIPCENMVVIDHGDGWQTGYYHVISFTVQQGQTVTRGQRIGGTSNEMNCGGASQADHVHVWISYLGMPTQIAGHDIGGWTVEAGPDPYDGCLIRGTIRRCTQDGTNYIVNDGEVGSSTGSPLASLDMNIGAVGDPISYVLDNFPANQPVTVTWKRGGGSTVPLGTVTTNAGGDATGSFVIPASPGGGENSVSFTAGALSRAINVRVLPSLYVNRDVARRGESIQVRVTGYGKQAPVTVALAPAGTFERITLATLTTNNTGGAAASLTIPVNAPLGNSVIETFTSQLLSDYASAAFFLADGPTINVRALSLQPGQTVPYDVILFPANTTFTLVLTTASSTNPVAALHEMTTDANGRASGMIKIPNVPHGDYQVRVIAGGSELASSRQTISPILIAPPGPWERGASVNLTAHGFTPGSQLTISWLHGGPPVVVGSGAADANGSATVTMTVPMAQDGIVTLQALDATGAEDLTGLEVQGGPLPGPPAVSITPVRSTVNNWIAYDLTNFPAYSEVTIEWRRTSGSTFVVGSALTDGRGQATGRFRVPATTGGPGQQIRFTSGAAVSTAVFDVVPRIKITPSPAARGLTVDVSLRGYGKKEVVRIRWKQGNSWVDITRVTTSNTGSANVKVTVPPWAPDGANAVRGDGSQFRAQTNVVQISGGNFAPASTSATATPSQTATVTPAASPSITATATLVETLTPEPTAMATEPAEPSPTETVTPEPSETATVTPTEESPPEPTEIVTEAPADEGAGAGGP
jgi:murein DD-endopeptidase MepM/ murein hydrolase activator NlpD